MTDAISERAWRKLRKEEEKKKPQKKKTTGDQLRGRQENVQFVGTEWTASQFSLNSCILR